jgi:hypothetical protein
MKPYLTGVKDYTITCVEGYITENITFHIMSPEVNVWFVSHSQTYLFYQMNVDLMKFYEKMQCVEHGYYYQTL